MGKVVLVGIGPGDPAHMTPAAEAAVSGADVLCGYTLYLDLLRERYRQACEYMTWFQPAWEQLTEDERYVLESFYSDINCYGSNAAYYIASHFGIEQSSAYKRKNRALDRLTVLLFGKA